MDSVRNCHPLKADTGIVNATRRTMGGLGRDNRAEFEEGYIEQLDSLTDEQLEQIYVKIDELDSEDIDEDSDSSMDSEETDAE